MHKATEHAASSTVEQSAQRLAELLKARRARVVFAESCTAGFVAAALGAIAGISEYLCGSVVAYRDQTKIDLLGVSGDDIARSSSVSETVASQMARQVLRRTPEADYAASITGHLGPDAPPGMSGDVYIGLARRDDAQGPHVEVKFKRLQMADRLGRRDEATATLLDELADFIAPN